MDDPKSRFCKSSSPEEFEAAARYTVSLSAGRYHDTPGRMAWRQRILANLLDEPYEPAWYQGWRNRIRLLRWKIRQAFPSVRPT